MKGKIIKGQNVVISLMLTEVITMVLYDSLTGWRLVLLFAVILAMMYRTLNDFVVLMLRWSRGARDEKKAENNNRGSVQGKHWSEVRFADGKQDNRDSAYDFVQIS